jgi:hypothetical protein
MENSKPGMRWEINGLGMGILIYAAASGVAKIIRAAKGIPETPGNFAINKKTNT